MDGKIFVFLDLVEIDLVAGLILITALATALIAGISFHEVSGYAATRWGRSTTPVGRNAGTCSHTDCTGTI
jgi:hypothetical protein